MAKHHSKHKHLAKSGGRDKHAHSSHHAMNAHHGTGKGMDSDVAYCDDCGSASKASHMEPSLTAEHYQGGDGQGVPGSMEGNYSHE
jgi:hypothetical protein